MRANKVLRSLSRLFLILLLPCIALAVEQNNIEKIAKPSSSRMILHPDLVLDRIWLDERSALHFAVHNAGPGILPDPEHARGQVRVMLSKGQKKFPLKQVDPAKALIKPGGAVSYNTQIVLTEPLQITVTVDDEGISPETNENNNARSEHLNPGRKKVIASGAQTHPSPAVVQPANSTTMMVQSEKPLTMQIPPRQDLLVAKELVEVPVDVFEPRVGALLHQGGEINVRWEINPSVSRDFVLPPSLYVDLYDQNLGGPWLNLYIGLNRQVRAIVPTDIADSDGYIVRLYGHTYVESTDTDYVFQGYSRRFRIERANGIVMIHPPETSPTTMDLIIGQPYTIEWNCTGTFADPVDIKLLTADGVNRVNLGLRMPCGNRRLTWQVGRGWTGFHSPDRLYRIRVESSLDRTIKAESAIFLINPPVFAISSPVEHVRWRRYSRQTISWSGGDGSTRLRIALFKDGEHFSNIARNLHPSIHSLDWRVSYGYTDYAASTGGLSGEPLATGTMGGVVLPAGNDYQIKISQEGSFSAYTLSDYFSITN